MSIVVHAICDATCECTDYCAYPDGRLVILIPQLWFVYEYVRVSSRILDSTRLQAKTSLKSIVYGRVCVDVNAAFK
jgi:hypothetical protein